MSKTSDIELTCSRCGHSFTASCIDMVNAGDEPELKEKILNGSIFVSECPSCGAKFIVSRPFVYIDPEQKLLVILSSEDLKGQDLQGLTGRRVESVGDLIEKIKIFDAGLDDIVIELCKFITAQDMGKDLPFKFFRLEGADNEITFAYPENGQMQMAGVGFKVYEDCRGIVNRNPVLREESAKLLKVDADWLAGYLK